MGNEDKKKAEYEARVSIENEYVRSLILMNGGSATALLAFLQAIWNDSVWLSVVSIISIGFFTYGLMQGVNTHFARYNVNRYRDYDELKYWYWWFLSLSYREKSLLAFRNGVTILVTFTLTILLFRQLIHYGIIF